MFIKGWPVCYFVTRDKGIIRICTNYEWKLSEESRPITVFRVSCIAKFDLFTTLNYVVIFLKGEGFIYVINLQTKSLSSVIEIPGFGLLDYGYTNDTLVVYDSRTLSMYCCATGNMIWTKSNTQQLDYIHTSIHGKYIVGLTELYRVRLYCGQTGNNITSPWLHDLHHVIFVFFVNEDEILIRNMVHGNEFIHAYSLVTNVCLYTMSGLESVQYGFYRGLVVGYQSGYGHQRYNKGGNWSLPLVTNRWSLESFKVVSRALLCIMYWLQEKERLPNYLTRMIGREILGLYGLTS